jgi:hypothetical protein
VGVAGRGLPAATIRARASSTLSKAQPGTGA